MTEIISREAVMDGARNSLVWRLGDGTKSWYILYDSAADGADHKRIEHFLMVELMGRFLFIEPRVSEAGNYTYQVIPRNMNHTRKEVGIRNPF
tara:strand:- start:928 stop:1206 length:279 start_codon:yes stop_codon:yes gene_type:complete